MNGIVSTCPFDPFNKPQLDQKQKPLLEVVLLGSVKDKIAQITDRVLLSIHETQLAESSYVWNTNINIGKAVGGLFAIVFVLVSPTIVGIEMTGNRKVESIGDFADPWFILTSLWSLVGPLSVLFSRTGDRYISRGTSYFERNLAGIIIQKNKVIESIRQKEKNLNLEFIQNYEKQFKDSAFKNCFIRLQDNEFVKHVSLLFTSKIKPLSKLEISHKTNLEMDQKEKEEDSEIIIMNKVKDAFSLKKLTEFLIKPDLIEMVSYNQKVHQNVKESMINVIPSPIIDNVILEYIAEFDSRP